MSDKHAIYIPNEADRLVIQRRLEQRDRFKKALEEIATKEGGVFNKAGHECQEIAEQALKESDE